MIMLKFSLHYEYFLALWGPPALSACRSIATKDANHIFELGFRVNLYIFFPAADGLTMFGIDWQ